MTFDEVLEELSRQHNTEMEVIAQMERNAASAKQRASVIGARIQGMEEARELLSARTVEGYVDQRLVPINGAKKPRRARRDIVALVRDVINEGGPLNPTPEVIAGKIGCPTRQVVRAMEKLKVVDSREPAAPGFADE